MPPPQKPTFYHETFTHAVQANAKAFVAGALTFMGFYHHSCFTLFCTSGASLFNFLNDFVQFFKYF